MATSGLFHWLQDTSIAQGVAHSHHLVGAGLQIVHVLGMLLLLASVLLLNLRAFGAGLRQTTAAPIVQETSRLLWFGLGLAAASGGLIFVSGAVRYVQNSAFDWKVALLAGAITLQLAALRTLVGVPAGEPAPALSRWLSASAGLLWFGVSGAGRAIGYI